MKLYYHIHNHQWQIHIIPSISLYFETHSPIQHKKILSDGFIGVFLQVQWFNKSIVLGLCKNKKF